MSLLGEANVTSEIQLLHCDVEKLILKAVREGWGSGIPLKITPREQNSLVESLILCFKLLLFRLRMLVCALQNRVSFAYRQHNF